MELNRRLLKYTRMLLVDNTSADRNNGALINGAGSG